jgi:hypothetical protein
LGIEVAEVTDMENSYASEFPVSTDGKWENGKPGESLKKPKIVRRNPEKTGFHLLRPAAAVQPSDTSQFWSEPFSRPGLRSVYSASAFAMIFPVFTSGF